MSIIASIRGQIVPVHREGLPFIGIFALASLLLFWLWSPLGWISTVLTIWCALFFRDPDRVTPTREGASVRAGERIGMIRFGSRVDVYLPEGTRPLVAEGQTAVAGETVIADLRATARELTFRVG